MYKVSKTINFIDTNNYDTEADFDNRADAMTFVASFINAMANREDCEGYIIDVFEYTGEYYVNIFTCGYGRM